MSEVQQHQEINNAQSTPSIWIRLEFCQGNMLNGKDEFINELRKEYIVQSREVWYPSFCEGTEFVMQVLAHFEELKGSILDTIEIEIIWKVLKWAWNSLSKFTECNESYYLKLELGFDDVTIIFHDVCPGNYGSLTRLVSNISEHIKVLKKSNLQNIHNISVNCTIPEELSDKINYDFDDPNIFEKSIWKIEYDLGCNTCYYDSNSKSLLMI